MGLAKLAGRHPAPAFERAVKRAGFGETQVLGDVLDRQGAVEQVMLGQFLAQVIEDLLVRRTGLMQLALQRAH
ncbi:hypothetical protein D3C72_715790 [compost metagenome]